MCRSKNDFLDGLLSLHSILDNSQIAIIQFQDQLDVFVIDYSENTTTDRFEILYRSVECSI